MKIFSPRTVVIKLFFNGEFIKFFIDISWYKTPFHETLHKKIFWVSEAVCFQHDSVDRVLSEFRSCIPKKQQTQKRIFSFSVIRHNKPQLRFVIIKYYTIRSQIKKREKKKKKNLIMCTNSNRWCKVFADSNAYVWLSKVDNFLLCLIAHWNVD